MMDRKPELLTDARCIVGEGPLWDSGNHRLLMVDIQGKRLRSIDWSSGKIADVILSQQTGFLFLDTDGGVYGGAQEGIYRIAADGTFTEICGMEHKKGERLNDGKVGPDGCLYFGTFSRDFSAAFYRMDQRKDLTELFEGVGNSNGLDWNADGRLLYYNDTPTGRTDCFDFTEDGALRNRRTVFRYQTGGPDGMTIDADGNLWTAVWGGGCVVCIDPRKGKILCKIELPVSQPSCCAFAGGDLRTLVITTAAHHIHLKEEPLAGAVFAVRVPVSGLEPNRIRFS